MISEMLALSFFSTETFATALFQAFNGLGTVLILWVWSTLIDNRRMYRLLLAINVTRFIVSAKVEHSQSGCIFAYISTTARARDFRFAGAVVQRL